MQSFHYIHHIWCTPTKQGTSRKVSFEIWAIEFDIGLKSNSSVDFEIFVFSNTLICFLSAPCNIWFSSIFPQKLLNFLQPVISKNHRNRKLWRPISQNHTSRRASHGFMHKWFYLKKLEECVLNFGIKLKLKVWSLQWYQKLILPKVSLVPCLCECITYVISTTKGL